MTKSFDRCQQIVDECRREIDLSNAAIEKAKSAAMAVLVEAGFNNKEISDLVERFDDFKADATYQLRKEVADCHFQYGGLA